jgi:hypothetical protein
MRRAIRFVPLALAMFVVAYMTLVVADGVYTFGFKHTATSTRTLQEDDPGWDCHTMGNHVCGVSESFRSKFQLYDRLFECFAEASYTAPKASWDSHVRRCIPDFD